MKKTDKQALREMDLAKLMQELAKAKKDLAAARLARAAGKREKGWPINLLADKVAVIRTIITEKQRQLKR